MGYTHYWTIKRDFTKEEWKRLTEYTRRLMQKSPAPLAGSNGEGMPEVTSKCIALNGVGSEAHESFILPRKVSEYDSYAREAGPKFNAAAWTFCKTALKPYDAVVIRILAAASQVSQDNLKASSDGGDEVFDNLGLRGSVPALWSK